MHKWSEEQQLIEHNLWHLLKRIVYFTYENILEVDENYDAREGAAQPATLPGH